jgi:hypothetical protein
LSVAKTVRRQAPSSFEAERIVPQPQPVRTSKSVVVMGSSLELTEAPQSFGEVMLSGLVMAAPRSIEVAMR